MSINPKELQNFAIASIEGGRGRQVVKLKERVAKGSGLRSRWMMVNPLREVDRGMEEGSVDFQVEWDTEPAHGTQKQIEER